MRRRWLLIAVAGVVVVLAAGAVVVWRAVRPPEISSFYDTPSNASAAKPGQLLRTERIDSRITDARLWRIIYASTGADGSVVAVSGLVAAPAAAPPPGGYPAVVVAHGTVGINRGCAPSIKPFAKVDDKNDAYAFLVGQYVSAGYATIMSDFQGLGVRGANSYLVGQVEGDNVLDSARALKAFSEVPVAAGFLIAGQSQGGHAALFAAQLAATYAPELTIMGVVAQAPATDLETLFSGIITAGKRGGIVSLPVMAADAYVRTYPGVDLNQVLTKRGRGALSNVVGKLCLFPAILGTQLARPADLLQAGGLTVLKPYVERNIPDPRATVPVFLAQGGSDQVVPPAITAQYADRLCAAGAALTFRRYPEVGHFDVVSASTPDVLAWMSAVRHGTPPRPTCAKR